MNVLDEAQFTEYLTGLLQLITKSKSSKKLYRQAVNLAIAQGLLLPSVTRELAAKHFARAIDDAFKKGLKIGASRPHEQLSLKGW